MRPYRKAHAALIGLALGLPVAHTVIAETTTDKSAVETDQRRDGRHGHRHGGRGASVERAALQNILSASLAQKTGRDAAEIATLFASSRPHEVAETLGLSDEDMREAMQSARRTLIDRSLAAGLITPAQAETLKTAPVGRGPRDGRKGG